MSVLLSLSYPFTLAFLSVCEEVEGAMKEPKSYDAPCLRGSYFFL